jgi:serine/threonine-protein kinase RsbW/sigma-B regulation protein RsbU (phosphoserine phosphatase)
LTAASARRPVREARVFAARMPALADARAFVEEFACDHGFSLDDVLRIVLVVEELFTNTLRHGHGRECDDPIDIALEAEGDVVTLQYRDTAARHDPFSGLEASLEALDAPLEDRPIGGLGVPLIAGLAEDVAYAFENGRNCLRVTLRAASARNQPCGAC